MQDESPCWPAMSSLASQSASTALRSPGIRESINAMTRLQHAIISTWRGGRRWPSSSRTFATWLARASRSSIDDRFFIRVERSTQDGPAGHRLDDQIARVRDHNQLRQPEAAPTGYFNLAFPFL